MYYYCRSGSISLFLCCHTAFKAIGGKRCQLFTTFWIVFTEVTTSTFEHFSEYFEWCRHPVEDSVYYHYYYCIPKQLVGILIFFKMVESTEPGKSFASLPYIKGVTESLTRIPKKHDVTVINKPLVTLQQQFLAPKFWPSQDSQTNVVSKIPCANC